ncbi:MAG: hypothetical protein H7X99_08175 [Saprospiraceae bacterium]|nr:hypothetical protein [Saprospiraceae bacterium]
MILPTAFTDNMRQTLSVTDYPDFIHALSLPAPTSIRIHPVKYNNEHPEKKVDWCHLGYYLTKRPKFTLDPAFHTGSYYVQEASSMFLCHVLKQITFRKETLRILDLCAAPGGKSTLIASWLNNDGLLVSNEVIKNRAYTLKYNILKEGYSNVLVTNNDPADFGKLENYFDIILVDAPCSGEGMFRKDPDAVSHWSPENVEKCSSRQKKILADVLPALKDEGHIIYATCTYNDAENIDNIEWCTKTFDLISVPIETDPSWHIIEIQRKNKYGYQFYPHKLDGEGFFISLMHKNKESKSTDHRNKSYVNSLQHLSKKQETGMKHWVSSEQITFLTDKMGTVHAINSDLKDEVQWLNHYLRLIYCGTSAGVFNKDIFKPDHSLALSLISSKDLISFELSEKDALLFLKKELQYVDTPQTSWIRVTYQGAGLGWIKNLGNRINNYLPAEHRILMKLEEE